MLDATKSYYTNESTHIQRSYPDWNDLGYSLDIPSNDIYSTGWIDAKPTHGLEMPWGSENKLTTTRKPEFYAPWGIVRSNVLPQINVKDPRYAFDRSKFEQKLF